MRKSDQHFANALALNEPRQTPGREDFDAVDVLTPKRWRVVYEADDLTIARASDVGEQFEAHSPRPIDDRRLRRSLGQGGNANVDAFEGELNEIARQG
jgi:hypothetical protein